MAPHRRGPWSKGEDSYLCQLVQTQGANNWVRIAQLIGSRSPKQCRERYHQNLKPTLNHDPISEEEGAQIERMVSEMGKRWAEIARRLHGRSDNAVKNWWNGSQNRRKRQVLRSKSTASGGHQPRISKGSHFGFEKDTPRIFAQPQASHIPFSGRYSSHQPNDRVMPSPTVSEASRAESVDGTPSLVSDASSAHSFSPHTANSPCIELPPLNYQPNDFRQPSISTLSSRSNQCLTRNDDNQLHFSSLNHPHNFKIQSLGTLSPPHYGFDQQRYATNTPSLNLPHQLSKEPQLHAHMDPSVRLPPLRPRNQYTPPIQVYERDSRMHLSSLLG